MIRFAKIGVRLALSCACTLPFSSWASDGSVDLRRIVDTEIRPLMAEYEVAGMALAVTVGGQTRLFNYGVASRATLSPVTESTLFEIGSISKTFTATLASYAQTLGKLSLDDHPGKYLPQLQGSALEQVSLLNLGTYTAGGFPLQLPEHVTDHAQMIEYFRGWQAQAAAGTKREYSNPSLGLFGHITALALNSDFAHAMETRIFPELGLKHSYIRVPAAAMPDYAWGYDQENKAVRVSPGVFADETYGIKLTAADLLRFVQANMDSDRLPATMRHALKGTHVVYFKTGEMLQGLGWEQYPWPISVEGLLAGNSESMVYHANSTQRLAAPSVPSGPTLFNKSGGTRGFSAYTAFVPQQKIGVVMLANKKVPIAARIKATHAILQHLASMTK